MKTFITRQPILFAIGITILDLLLELGAFASGSLAGLPEVIPILLALVVSIALPLGFIWGLGWWRDAGFVTTTQNIPALIVPFLLIFIF